MLDGARRGTSPCSRAAADDVALLQALTRCSRGHRRGRARRGRARSRALPTRSKPLDRMNIIEEPDALSPVRALSSCAGRVMQALMKGSVATSVFLNAVLDSNAV